MGKSTKFGSSLTKKLNERVIGQAYDTLNRLIQTRSNLITNYENSFPLWHYGNLYILALAICFIFLTLTDKPALLFLGGFQLRICWAMLIGTFSMLAVVIYDLNSILSGTFQVKIHFMCDNIIKCNCFVPFSVLFCGEVNIVTSFFCEES